MTPGTGVEYLTHLRRCMAVKLGVAPSREKEQLLYFLLTLQLPNEELTPADALNAGSQVRPVGV